jgi:sacsin
LLHDVKKVYQYFADNLKVLKENGELAEEVLCKLRNEPLFLNINNEEETLNWVQGSSLIIDCHDHEGSMQGVRAFLRPFEEILIAAGAVKVQHPTFVSENATQPSTESGLWSSFDRLRRERLLTDVIFIVEPTEALPNPEPLIAHRAFLAVASEGFKDFFCQKSQDACPGCPLPVPIPYSWECVRLFLGEYHHGYFSNSVF